MKRSSVLAVLVALAGCDAGVKIDPEGYRCDVGNVCPTNYACRDGVCHRSTQVGPDSCADVVCDAPPAPSCSGNTANTFVGRCVSGTCQYDPVPTTCATTCDNGACADACAGVSCVTPPQTACTDANTLRTFAQTGACEQGGCTYKSTDTACPNGCEAARCKGVDLCATMGVTCTTPPAAVCMGNTRRSFATTGTCDPGTGVCTYAQSDTNCPNGCALGQCLTASLAFAQTGPRIRFAINALDIAPGSSGNSALAVGDDGKIARWDGSMWTELMTPPNTGKLNAVSFVTGSVAYAVGANRTAFALRPAANQVLGVTLPGTSTANLVAISGRSENEVLVADDSGEWWRLRNSMWTNGQLPAGNGPYDITAAYLDESLRERVVGSCGSGSGARCVAYRFVSGGTPNWTVQQQMGAPGFAAVGGAWDVPTTNSSSEAFVGRSDTTVATHTTAGFTTTIFFTSLTTTPSLDGDGVIGITAQSTGVGRDVFVLTSSAGSATGHLYRLSRNLALQTTANDALQTFYGEEHLSPNEANGVLVAEVRRSRNVNNVFRRGVITNEALDVGEDFAGATVDDTGALIAASIYGDVVVRRPTSSTWDFRRPANEWSVNALEGRNGTGTLLVGEDAAAGNGLVVRLVGTTFTTIATQPGVTFNGVCRVSDTEGWAVGTGGTIVRVTGSGTSAVTSPTTKDLEAVDCAAGVAVACGADGTVLRQSGGAWTVVPAPLLSGLALKTCKLSGQGAFVGANGSFFSFTPGSGWSTLPSPRAGLRSLVVRGPQEIYGAFVTNTATPTTDILRFDGAAWSPALLTATGALGGGVQAGSRVVWGGTLGAIVEAR
jgi:hypothetical protein